MDLLLFGSLRVHSPSSFTENPIWREETQNEVLVVLLLLRRQQEEEDLRWKIYTHTGYPLVMGSMAMAFSEPSLGLAAVSLMVSSAHSSFSVEGTVVVAVEKKRF